MTERIQRLIYLMEVGGGSRWLKFLPLAVAVLGLAVLYDLRVYRGFSSAEAMDAAQVARNLAEGNGYSTDFIRPFSLYLVKKHNQKDPAKEISQTNVVDAAQIKGPHPDLANPPVYPVLLASLMKTLTPDWKVQTSKPFWSEGGNFRRYEPEFRIAILNQLLLLTVVALTFLIAKKLFDAPAAWLAALLTLGAELLWKFSISGQSTMLLLVIFLGLVRCVISIEEAGRAASPSTKRLFVLAVVAGLLTGVGMLTRYSFGWLIVPVAVFLVLFGGVRRPGLAVAAFLAFGVVVLPWIIRNLAVSGTLFGTAGYAVVEGTFAFPGSRLMQSVNPDLTSAFWMRPYLRKFMENTRFILHGDLLRLGGGWVAILFFAGLLLGLRSVAARRLRYFTLMCLGMLVVVQAMGKTSLSDASPEVNSENLLVLLTPLVVIFGVVFFLTLLNQMKVPTPQIHIAVVVLLALIAWQPLVSDLLPPKNSPVAYPPYYPPDVQRIAGWMKPDELLMSDVPWAVAWYGDRKCVWTTVNANDDFYAVNDYIENVNGLYLTLNTMDARLVTGCMQGGPDSWSRFVFRIITANELPKGFPLRNFPLESLQSGMFLSDRQRWK